MYSLYLQKTNINKIMIIRWFRKCFGPAADDDVGEDGSCRVPTVTYSLKCN
jgi:hypothetical protein